VRRILIFTTGSGCPVTNNDANLPQMSSNLFCSGIWGLIRTARIEMPKTNILCIDSDQVFMQSPTDINILADQLLHELNIFGSDSLEVAFRGNSRFIPRLKLFTPITLNHSQQSFIFTDQNGVALITGGLGGLGLVSAEALVEAGLHCIVLVSRSGTIKRSNQGLEQKLESLQSIPGVQIILEKCDMSVEHQVESLLARVRNLGPLKVIIHAAGVVSDALLVNQTEDSMKTVWGAKADGAWYLHKYTLGVDNDLQSFILFSSIASLVGRRSACNYASANSYLDGLCIWRRSRGLPCSSIEWALMKKLVCMRSIKRWIRR
jgi:hypothetical protein